MFFRFHFVEFVITAHQQRNQFVAALFAAVNNQGFDGFLNRQIKLFNQLRDSFRVWCINQFHCFLRCRALSNVADRFRQFDIGRVIGLRGENHIIFAALCQNLELVGCTSADRAGICHYCTEIQSDTVEDFAVRLIHRIVRLLQRILSQVERVRIFHDEFTGAHHTKTRTSSRNLVWIWNTFSGSCL